MKTHNKRFPTLWESKIGKYLTIKIQQGNKGEKDIILYVQNGHNYLWESVDKDEFFNAWNSSRNNRITLETIHNETELQYAIQHAVFNATKSCTDEYRKHVYHDIPNVLMGIAEMENYGERYVNILMRRKGKK